MFNYNNTWLLSSYVILWYGGPCLLAVQLCWQHRDTNIQLGYSRQDSAYRYCVMCIKLVVSPEVSRRSSGQCGSRPTCPQDCIQSACAKANN